MATVPGGVWQAVATDGGLWQQIGLELLGYTFLLFFQEVPKHHFRHEMGRRASSGHETSTKLHEISTRIHWKRPRRLKIGFSGKTKV